MRSPQRNQRRSRRARTIEHANRVLVEMQARDVADAHAEEEYRAAELTR